MKGSMEGALPMMGLLILAAALGFQTFPIADAFATIFGQTTEDYSNVVETRSYGEFYFYNYIPLAAEYSINDAAYELGKDAGNFTWESSNLGGTTSTYAELTPKWRKNSTDQLNSRISGVEGGCRIPDRDFGITLFGTLDVNDTRFSVNAKDSDEPASIEVICPSMGTRYFSADRYGVIDRAVNNRYTDLSYDVSGFYNDLKQELNSINPSDGVAHACSSTTAEIYAEEEAQQNLHTAVREAIERVSDDYPTENFISEKLQPEDNYFIYGSGNWKWESSLPESRVERSGSTSSNEDGCCDPCDEGCCDDRYEGNADADPSKVRVPWLITDKKQKVIVDRKYRNLLFNTTERQSYKHVWN
jgi:hypothetical protein